ncbi:hypothetical protein H6P81_020016 [Aristolochia fimbriata]|uniref:Uncharacterized protein n=1 Tax=Aristolochia fimbriata TaxID=158543 RepID=A0AAV7DUH9_ARIFI|nr:hypothetical protein H6P81_020016 [Aristolochia fimbriata]
MNMWSNKPVEAKQREKEMLEIKKGIMQVTSKKDVKAKATGQSAGRRKNTEDYAKSAKEEDQSHRKPSSLFLSLKPPAAAHTCIAYHRCLFASAAADSASLSSGFDRSARSYPDFVRLGLIFQAPDIPGSYGRTSLFKMHRSYCFDKLNRAVL